MESIRLTVEWYKSVWDGKDALTETRKQITAFMENKLRDVSEGLH
jgi:hypothetical protein